MRAQAQEKSRLDEILARGQADRRCAFSRPHSFGFIDDKGELVGFDIDIAKLLAKTIFNGDDSPKRIELVKQGFAARWPNVESGAVDIAGIQVTTILPGSGAAWAFTRPYIDSGIVLIVRNNPRRSSN